MTPDFAFEFLESSYQVKGRVIDLFGRHGDGFRRVLKTRA